jgi:N-acetylmuramoyl-L-alanine amidase
MASVFDVLEYSNLYKNKKQNREMKPLIILTAGHHANDSGATSNVWGNENINSQRLRDTIKFYLKKHDIDVFYDQDNWTLGEVMSRAKTAALGRKYVLAIDIHFNSFYKPEANGTEVIVDNNASKEVRAMGAKLSQMTADTLEIFNRGVKTERDSHHSNLGYLDITKFAFVDEVCFLSNDGNMRALESRHWVWSKQRAEYIIDWVRQNEN